MHEQFKIAGLISEGIAALFATFYFYKYRDTKLKPLLFILWYIIINELLCQYVFAKTQIGFFLYNLYDLILPSSVLYLIITQLKNTLRRQVVTILLALTILIFISSCFFTNPFVESSVFNFITFTILTIIALLIYFVELLKSDQVLIMGRNIFFWFTMGFLIFFLTYPIIALARQFIDDDKEILRALNYIQFIVSIVAYLTIAFGFYWGKKRQS